MAARYTRRRGRLQKIAGPGTPRPRGAHRRPRGSVLGGSLRALRRPATATGSAGAAGRGTVAGGRPPLRRGTVARVGLSLGLVLGIWSATGGGTYAALSGGTENSGNAFSAGTVTMTDNDGGSTAMFAVTGQRPGVPESGCIRVTYTGSLSAGVRLYASSVTGSLAQYVNLTVTRGTDSNPVFDNCTNFSPAPTDYSGLGPGVLYSGPLSTYPTSHATGLTDPVATWTNGTAASYRFTVEIADNNAAQGLSANAAFAWEARS